MDFEPDKVFVLVVGVVRRIGDVLMVRQAGPGEQPYWSLPGGRVEPNEPLLEALAREIVEETGVRIAHSELLCVKQVLMPGSEVDMLVFMFTCEPASPGSTTEPQDPDGFVLEAAYLPVAEAISHLETLFGPNEPSVAHLTGLEVESIRTIRQSQEESGTSAAFLAT
jgi:ADP-ribose pyrophosphatase YjhB (NUDIX family)